MNYPVNAAQKPTSLDADGERADDAAAVRLSAWFDGELDQDDACADQSLPADAQRRWATYQLVGSAMRQSSAARGVRAVSSGDFLASVMAGIGADGPADAEAAVQLETPHAAALKGVSGLPSEAQPLRQAAPVVAANDGVYRWKWAAGFASTVAAMAVAWGLLGQAPTGEPLASAPPLAPGMALATAEQGLFAVQTSEGVLLLDPGLEALVSAHRQQGALVGLQMPTGFLRSTTFEEPSR